MTWTELLMFGVLTSSVAQGMFVQELAQADLIFQYIDTQRTYPPGVSSVGMFHVSTRKKQPRKIVCINRKLEIYLLSATLLAISLWSVISSCCCKNDCVSTTKLPFRHSLNQYNRQEHVNDFAIHVQRSLKKYEAEVLQKVGETKTLADNKTVQSKEKVENVPLSYRLKRNISLLRANNRMAPKRMNRSQKSSIFQSKTGGPIRRLPQAIIVGVKKAGTRALLEYLRLHPDIRGTGPEPHFFDRHYHLGLDWYRNKMPPSNKGQITIEKTPRYFVMPEVPSRISSMSKDIKVIIVVRDPITRAISDYTQGSSKDPNATETFVQKAFHANGTGGVHKNWSALKTGIYVKHVRRWLNYFSLTQMHFVSGENLIANPTEEVQNVTDFLNLRRFISDKHFYFNETKGFPCLQKNKGSTDIKCFDSSKGRPHATVEEKYIERLRHFYRPYNEEFYQLVGKDFGWS